MGIIGRMLLENVAASALEKVIDKNEKEDNKLEYLKKACLAINIKIGE